MWYEIDSAGNPINWTSGDLAGDENDPKVVHVTESSKTLTYTNGILTGYSDAVGTKTFYYTDGLLTSIIGTGKYQSKTLTYSNGILVGVTI